MVTLGGTSMSMYTKPQQTAAINASYSLQQKPPFDFGLGSLVAGGPLL